MASTFTDLGLELMATGENAGTWGTKTNANLSLAEQLLGGFKIQTLNAAGAGANTTALAIADGALTGAAQNRVIILGAVSPQAITGNKIVTFPLLAETFYFIKNSTSGAYTVQLKAASGSGATVTFSATDKGYKVVYLDGVATNTGVIEVPLGADGDVTLTGTQTLTNKTLTSPVIGTKIADTGGNELLLLTATASAVNEFTLANAASGNGPRLSATGETNVDLDLLAKGTGHITVRGNSNVGTIQLNCENNSHGQQLKAQPHSVGSSAVSTLPNVTAELVPGKIEGTNFGNSLLVGHATTGTLNDANRNVGVGISSLVAVQNGDDNTAVGYRSGSSLTSGGSNTIIGNDANRTGNPAGSTSLGYQALLNNAGTNNVGLGNQAGKNITSGDGNVIIGMTDAASATGDRQLKIAGYDGSTRTTWISGDSSGNVTVAGTLTSTTGLVKTAGLETMWVPASAMYASTTAGASPEQVETTAGRPDMKVLDFDAGTDEFAQFSVAFPKSWNEGTITYQFYWTPSNTNTGNVYFQLMGVACGDSDTIDVAFGTGIQVTDAGIGTVEDQQISAVSAAVTIAGSPAAGEQTYFQVKRNADDGGDTFTGDCRLLGVRIFYTTDAANDA